MVKYRRTILYVLKEKVKVKSLSRVRLFATPWTVAYQAPLSMGFSGKNTGVGCHFLLKEKEEKICCLKIGALVRNLLMKDRCVLECLLDREFYFF